MIYCVSSTDSNFRSNLSVGILRLSEKGILYKIRNKWFNNNASTCDHNGPTNDDGQFDMNALRGLFIILIVGVIFSFIIGIVEFLWHVHKIAVKEKVSVLSGKIRTFKISYLFLQIKPMLALKGEIYFLIRLWERRKPLRTYRESRDSTSTGYSSLGKLSSSSSVKKRKKSKSRAE